MKDDVNEKILEVLSETSRICEDRYLTYGDPLDTYTSISALSAAFIEGQSKHRGIDETAMICLEIIKKLVRVQKNPGYLDSWNDIIGYAACGHVISERKYGRR